MAGRKRSLSNEADVRALHKEWDEASCPICMDHPHNAVLLMCGSHEKGCRSYICDTSYRHSNCLDRFKKLRSQQNTYGGNLDPGNADLGEAHGNINLNGSDHLASAVLAGGLGETSIIQDGGRHLEVQGEGILETGDSETLWGGADLEGVANGENSLESKKNLRCPMCRGTVLGWKVVEEARKYLNLKPRSCSRESCSFIGNYGELRRHARRAHPTDRPADVDPSRQRAWQCLEHQREYDDIVSAIRSAMPGAVVFGDYFIENRDSVQAEREIASREVNGSSWWTTFFLFQMIGSMDPVMEARQRSRAWSGQRRSTGASSARRRFLWGENLLGLQDDDSDDDDDNSFINILSDIDEGGSPIPRRRRRLTRSRSDDDQS
ncbi:hypothetical protein U1Q18_045672 [Sarracenia purpurea var. burkii]